MVSDLSSRVKLWLKDFLSQVMTVIVLGLE
jgi:hypothetical protein